MAQGDHRPKHARYTSRNVRLANVDSNNIGGRKAVYETVNDNEKTTRYIKSVLCAESSQDALSGTTTNSDLDLKPLDELLPPLTSSNEIDIQLYAIIAVVLNLFVKSWFQRITPNNEFVGEVVKIIAHCTRGIEQRFRHVDLENLLLDELPALFINHVDMVTVAQDASVHKGSSNQTRMIYHSMHPNKALTPLPDNPANISVQQENELAWSQLLVTRILPLVLPPEDLENPCLHVLVSEILSEMIVHNAICGKGSEPWVIWEGVTKLINSLMRSSPTQQPPVDDTSPTFNKLEQFGLVSSTEGERGEDLQQAQHQRIDVIAQVFWTTLHMLSLAWLLVRSLAKALMHESSIPARSSRGPKVKKSNRLSVTAVEAEDRPGPQPSLSDQRGDQRPVVSMRIWSCISRLMSLEHRMPWAFGVLSLFQWLSLYGPGQLCRRNGALDRLMSSKIDDWLSRPDLLPRLLLAIRSALFPDNALAITRQTPTSAEVEEIKRECAKTIVQSIPSLVRTRYFATKDMDLMRQDVEGTLDLFADPYINKHLIVSAVELVVVRLFPEIGEDVAEE